MSYEEHGLKLFTGSQIRVEMEARKKKLTDALARYNAFRSGTVAGLADALTEMLDFMIEFSMTSGARIEALGLKRELYLTLAQHGARVTRVRTHDPALTDDGKRMNVAEYVYVAQVQGTTVTIPIRYLEGGLIRIALIQSDGKGRDLRLM